MIIIVNQLWRSEHTLRRACDCREPVLCIAEVSLNSSVVCAATNSGWVRSSIVWLAWLPTNYSGHASIQMKHLSVMGEIKSDLI